MLTRLQKALLIFLVLAAALLSAQLPALPDNESYYIQTIKWINGYGLVKGLGNLHIFLAQASPWHVLQAGTNFSFVSGNINDLNGFVYCTALFFFLQKSRQAMQSGWIAFMPLLSVAMLFFIDSPSPDLPLLAVLPIVVCLFLESNIRTAWLLFLFLCFIKITITPAGLLFLYPLLKQKKLALFFTSTGMAVLLLWAFKNILTSGYPAYPLTVWKTSFDWTVPENLIAGLNHSSNSHIYGTTSGALKDKLLSWFLQHDLKAWAGKIYLLLLLMFPFFTKIRNDRRYIYIWGAFGCQFIVLLVTSPQLRFYLPGMLLLMAFALSEIYSLLRLRWPVSTLPVLTGLAVAAIIPLVATRQASNLLFLPGGNTAYPEMEFTAYKMGNLHYYSPADDFHLYGTGNGPLPCVNKAQVERFRSKYNIVPQLRGKTLSEGFYYVPATAGGLE